MSSTEIFVVNGSLFLSETLFYIIYSYSEMSYLYSLDSDMAPDEGPEES